MFSADRKRFEAPIWAVDPHVRAAELARLEPSPKLRDRLTQLLRSDAAAFDAEVRAAWESDDITTVICGGQLRLDHGGLKRSAALRYWRALSFAERYAEAAEVMRDERFARPEEAFYWVDLAAALVGSGSWSEALDSVNEALRLDPGLKAATDLRVRLDEAVDLSGRSGDLDWTRTVRLIAQCLAWNCRGEARQALLAFLAAGRPAPPRTEELFATARELIDDAPRQEALSILGGLRKFCTTAETTALDHTLAVISGLEFPSVTAGEPGTLSETLRRCLASACAAAGRFDGAVAWLSQLSTPGEVPVPGAIRLNLARAMGRDILGLVRPGFAPGGGRIFNIMPFNDELTILRVRLEEMADWVERFVIVESRLTYTGRPKPLHFDNARADFAPWADKIVHLIVDRFPDYVTSPWARDFYQHDMAVAGLKGLCRQDDLVLITDADEIVDRRAVEGFDGDLAGLRWRTYRYFLNYRRALPKDQQRGLGAIVRGRILEQHGSSYLRGALSQYDPQRIIQDAGWHFTSMGSPERIARKLQSYAHHERAHRGEDHFRRHLLDLQDGVFEAGWERQEIDETFPSYIRRNREALEDFIL